MRESSKKFLQLFFNDGEEICFSPNKYAYPSKPQVDMVEDKVVLVAINPINGQRSDENVTAYRTFMVECDDISIQEQKEYIDTMGFPYSYCVHSGGKSLHFALVLDKDYPSEKIYRYTYQWILNILEKADQKTKNPSRSIRFPGSIRPESGKMQELIYMGERISQDKLLEWLNKFKHKRPPPEKKRNRTANPNVTKLPTWCVTKLKEGVHNLQGSRNQTWMSLACQFSLDGYTLDDTISILESYFEEQSDFKKKEWIATIKSGFNYASKI